MIIKMEEVLCILIMINGKEIDMKENIKMMKEKEKEYIIIVMVTYMMENGKMVIKKEKEFFIGI